MKRQTFESSRCRVGPALAPGRDPRSAAPAPEQLGARGPRENGKSETKLLDPNFGDPKMCPSLREPIFFVALKGNQKEHHYYYFFGGGGA